jgi:hypothetical protein
MSPEALTTLLGLAAAVYALLPAERKLDLHLRLGAVDRLILLAALLLVVFLTVLAAVGVAPHWGPWRWGITPARASYLALLAAAIFVTIRVSRTLSRSAIPRFRDLLEKLLHQRRYADLIFLLDRHLETLCRAYTNDYLRPRVRAKLDPPNLPILTQPERKPSPVVRRLARLLPRYGGSARDAAKGALRRLLLTEDCVRELAKIQPYLALRILEQGLVEVDGFQALWLTALLDDTRSVLYYEVTSAIEHGGIDGLPDDSRILHFYLDDIPRARKLRPNKALGEYVSATLDRLHRSATTDRYNQPWADFEKGPRVTDPVYAALILFRLLVSAAIRQDVAWPIPFYHFCHFTEFITRNLPSDAGVDLTTDPPTPYHFFLDQMVSWLCEWIKSAPSQPKGGANAALRLDDLRDNNGDIPKNAVLALGTVSKTIITATTVDDRFKVRVLETILRLEGDPYQPTPLHPFGDLVLESIVAGGDTVESSSDNVNALHPIKSQVDPVLRATGAFKRLEQILTRY